MARPREAGRVKMHGGRLYFLQLHDGAGSSQIPSVIINKN
jgi:hypothetical protein